MAKKSPKRMWMRAADRRVKPSVPDELKAEVAARADELVRDVLKPNHLKPPPKKPRWNHLIDIWTKWHRSFFYFGGTYASPGPNALSPTFELRFARLEYAGDRRFNLAYMRHTGQWWQIHEGLTLGECLKTVGEGGLFSP